MGFNGPIGIISQFSYPHHEEIRLQRFAKSFAERGWHTYIFCPEDKMARGSEVGRLKTIHRKRRCLPSRFARAYPYLDIVNVSWVIWLSKHIRQRGIKLLIVRNIRLSLVARIASWQCRIPLITDVSENYEAIAELSFSSDHRWLPSLRPPSLVAAYCRLVTKFSDEIWVVCNENADRLAAARSGKNRPVVIGNYPTELERQAARRSRCARRQNPSIFVYAGLVDSYRGLELPIRALSLTPEGRCRLIIVGHGSHEGHLKRLANELAVLSRIEFLGFRTRLELLEILGQSDVGIIPHLPNSLTANTLPNKLFDYLAAGLPVLATPTQPVARILAKWDCGVIVPADERQWASAFLELTSDIDQFRRLQKSGKKASDLEYRWQEEEVKVIHSILSLVQADPAL